MKVDLSPINNFTYCQVSNYKFQFLLLDEQNRALHSPFECKDYIQDMFYCEMVGKAAGIWGISWKPGMMNINRPKFRMALMGGPEELWSHRIHLKKFLNAFEDALGFPRSRVLKGNDNTMIVVEFPKEWTQNGPLLSAFTTLIRLSAGYTDGDVMEYMRSAKAQSQKMERSYPKYAWKDYDRVPLERLNALLHGKLPKHNWADFQSIHYVHDTGLVGFNNFPEVILGK